MKTGLDGKVVLITGAASGIGAASARAFAAENARLALLDRDQSGLEVLAKELRPDHRARTPRPTCPPSPVSSAASTRCWHHMTVGVDVLFNNVGAGSLGTFDSLTDADWVNTLQLNFLSQVRAITAVLPAMRAAGRGVIVNNASDLGRQPISAGPDYAASKAAILSLTSAWRSTKVPRSGSTPLLPARSCQRCG